MERSRESCPELVRAEERGRERGETGKEKETGFGGGGGGWGDTETETETERERERGGGGGRRTHATERGNGEEGR